MNDEYGDHLLRREFYAEFQDHMVAIGFNADDDAAGFRQWLTVEGWALFALWMGRS